MGKVSPALKKWRARKGKGAIMKPSTFERIKRSAAAKGYRNPAAVAGRAYWNAAKAQMRTGKRRVGKKKH